MSERFVFGRNLAILSGGEVLARALTFAAFTWLARALDPTGYGRVELTLAAMMFLTLFVDLGLGMLGTREIAARRATVSGLICRIVSAQAVLAVIVYALLCLVVLLVPLEPMFRRLLLGFGVSLFGMPFLLPWVFQGRSRMAPVAVLQVLRQSVFVVIVLVLIRTPADLLRLPWAEVLAVGAAAVGYVLILQRSGEPSR